MKKYIIELADDKMTLLKGLKREFNVSNISDVVGILAGSYQIMRDQLTEDEELIGRLHRTIFNQAQEIFDRKK